MPFTDDESLVTASPSRLAPASEAVRDRVEGDTHRLGPSRDRESRATGPSDGKLQSSRRRTNSGKCEPSCLRNGGKDKENRANAVAAFSIHRHRSSREWRVRVWQPQLDHRIVSIGPRSMTAAILREHAHAESGLNDSKDHDDEVKHAPRPRRPTHMASERVGAHQSTLAEKQCIYIKTGGG